MCVHVWITFGLLEGNTTTNGTQCVIMEATQAKGGCIYAAKCNPSGSPTGGIQFFPCKLCAQVLYGGLREVLSRSFMASQAVLTMDSLRAALGKV